jgi:hypothetical protein
MRRGQTGRPHGRNPNGSNVKIQGNAHQIYERYVALAREASTSGDRVAAENLYQHADHYFRVMNAANEGHQPRATHPNAPADLETEMADEEGSELAGSARASPSDRQPYPV